jgi:EAL domain-containing protein (putative c-di-GMP-specific phosphodiesterase class I)
MTASKELGNIYSISAGRALRQRRDLESHGAGDLSKLVNAQSEIARAGLDLKRVVDAITNHAQLLTDSTGAVIEMIEGTDLMYWSGSGALHEHEGLRIAASGSLSGLSIEKGTVLRCRDSESDGRVNRQACRQVGARSALVTPLECNGELVGVLKVISDQVNAYTDRHLELLQALATFTGSMLNSALKYSRLAETAEKVASIEASERESMKDDRARLCNLIESRGITPVFQPILELTSGRIVGHEALSRFNAIDNLTVDGWFALADHVGMCLDLETACIAATIEALGAAKPVPGYVSLNVSPRTLREFDFDSLPPREGGWVLELTEHTQVDDYAVLSARVKELQAKGFRIAIDDVGAGFSSLRHVLRLSPDIVKLDLSITRDIDQIRRHQLLASAIIAFSRESGIGLVAEGVETLSERDTLLALGVPCGQGYLFGKPALLE